MGDCNTWYFHARAKERRALAKVSCLVDLARHRLTYHSQIKEEFLSYCKNLLATKAPPFYEPSPDVTGYCSCLYASQAESLIVLITLDEVKDALSSMGFEKAPGPEGFNAGFFKLHWELMGSLLPRVVLHCLKSGKISKPLAATSIHLIPKSRHACRAGDYKPISCCNVVNKLIPKILTLRLQPLLPFLISRNQGGFVKGRSIADNILLCGKQIRG